LSEQVKDNEDSLDAYSQKQVIPALIIIQGVETGKILLLLKSANFVGREDSAEITINDPAVSRKHILIEVDEKHICCLDLGSTNGTYVNNERIEKRYLNEGDKIKIGNTVLKFSYQDRDDKEYQDKVYQMITFDELTSLYNVRYMFRQINLSMERAKKGEALSLLFIDIDFFKKVNDVYGHLSGSKLLSDFGQLILSSIRSTDFACRYGGEEFVVIMPRTNLQRSFLAAEKLRKIVEAHSFASTRNEAIKITISIGVASYNSSIATAQKLIDLADKAMYKAKQKGRNRVEYTFST
jgi:diguanylate cyclase (GGDEF)-like protein